MASAPIWGCRRRLPRGPPCSIRPASRRIDLRRRARRGVNGQVAEWSIAHAWKACVRESVPRVRIPLCPPPGPPLDARSAGAGKYLRHCAALEPGQRSWRVSARLLPGQTPHHYRSRLLFREASRVSAGPCLQGSTGKSDHRSAVIGRGRNGKSPEGRASVAQRRANSRSRTGNMILGIRDLLPRIRELSRPQQGRADPLSGREQRPLLIPL